jgi:outer membrane immunogenic protein
MRFTSILFAASAALLCGTAVSSAADLIIEEVAAVETYDAADWSGLYAGLHIGLGSGAMVPSATNIQVGGGQLGGLGLPDGEDGYEPSGLLAGGQIGAMFQTGMFVLGVQGDVSWSNMTGGYINADDPPDSDDTMNVLWLANLTGRAGVAFDNVLVYALAGLAMASAENVYEGESSGAVTFGGYTVGIGGAVQLDDAWSLFAEATYSEFGEEAFEFSDPGDNITSDLAVATFKVGVNYSF